MALIEENAVNNAFDRLVKRGVFEDDVSCLAAEFEGEALAGASEGALDGFSHGSGTREGDFRGQRMIDDGGSGFAGAGDEIDDARWQARVLQHRGEFERGDRRRFRRLEDDRITGGEGRGDFPREHQQREIPRNDLADHA